MMSPAHSQSCRQTHFVLPTHTAAPRPGPFHGSASLQSTGVGLRKSRVGRGAPPGSISRLHWVCSMAWYSFHMPLSAFPRLCGNPFQPDCSLAEFGSGPLYPFSASPPLLLWKETPWTSDPGPFFLCSLLLLNVSPLASAGIYSQHSPDFPGHHGPFPSSRLSASSQMSNHLTTFSTFLSFLF